MIRCYIILFVFYLLISINSVFTQSINVSNGNVFDGEPFLAINPNNSQHLVVAWMSIVPFNYVSIKSKVSFNGGQTWSSEEIIPHSYTATGTISADPSLDFDNAGNLFLCYVDYNISIDSGSVNVRKSSDGGLTWGEAIEVINAHSDPGKYPIDRPWMQVDRSGSINEGNIYVTTMPPTVFGLIEPPYHPYFIHSTDGGNSFNQWRYLDTINWLSGNIISQPTPFSSVSNNGSFNCVYPSWIASQNLNPQFIFAKTNNSGNSFTYNSLVIPYTYLYGSNDDTLAKLSYPLLVDPTNSNHLIFLNLLKLHGDADVFMWESYDAGISWNDSIRINDDLIGNNKLQDLIWADFDTDGDLVVSWRDRRNATDSTFLTSSEIWASVRYKDSISFYPNFRISDTIVAYDSILAYSGNDFMCIKMRNDTLYSVWGDTRDGKLNIWFKKMNYSGEVISIQQLSNDKNLKINVFPNPLNNLIEIQADKIIQIIIRNTNGQQILSYKNLLKENVVIIDMSKFSSGTYMLNVLTENGEIFKSIVKK
ncbi:MAG: T9SS type A sorting domain-containing protein [Flavobacteriia bacterium]|nr:T9SS type A sorting domain-containing protein [Flavobacteriia bacterium]